MSDDTVEEVLASVRNVKAWLLGCLIGGGFLFGGWSTLLTYRLSALEKWQEGRNSAWTEAAKAQGDIYLRLGVLDTRVQSNGDAVRRVQETLDRMAETARRGP